MIPVEAQLQPADKALGDHDFFKSLREKEYPLLDIQKQVYLDYTGGNLCPKTLLAQHLQFLSENILGNPHSTNPTSLRATALVAETRNAILEFFSAADYECIFTANASAALKIVGESYPFTKDSTYLLFSDNHNSVNGIWEYCKRSGGKVAYAKVKYEDLTVDSNPLKALFEEATPGANNLFAFPAQSNVSGVKHDLGWIEAAQKKGFDVLLDAAAFVPTSKLDLSIYKPDFVSMSFYKIFGYPTGIGCLLVKKSKFEKLQKPWFAGGTVSIVSVVRQEKILVHGYERFEDGTLNYALIPGIKAGLDYINAISMERISVRIKYLIKYLYTRLRSLKHDNGMPLLKLFGPADFEHRGGNIIMNFFDDKGRRIAFEGIEQEANQRNISIRSGCFCNPGLDEINYCVTPEEMARYFSFQEPESFQIMRAALIKMRGAIRVSVGLGTNTKDLDAFVAFVESIKGMEAS